MAQPDSFFDEHADRFLTNAHKKLLLENLLEFKLKLAQFAVKPDYSPTTYNEHDKEIMEELKYGDTPNVYIEHGKILNTKTLIDLQRFKKDGLITVVQTEDEVKVGDGKVGTYIIIAEYIGVAFSKNRKKRATTKTSMRKKRSTTKTSMRKKRHTIKTSMRKKRRV